MNIVLIRFVIELMVVVCLVVKKMKIVVRIYFINFFENFENCILCIFEKFKFLMRVVVFNSMNYLYSVLKLFFFF